MCGTGGRSTSDSGSVTGSARWGKSSSTGTPVRPTYYTNRYGGRYGYAQSAVGRGSTVYIIGRPYYGCYTCRTKTCSSCDKCTTRDTCDPGPHKMHAHAAHRLPLEP